MITKDDVIAKLKEYKETRADQVNPMDLNGCMYTDKEDPTRHCIAGQMLTDWKLPLPIEGQGVWGYLSDSSIGFEATEFLSKCQAIADGLGSMEDGEFINITPIAPRKWGDVADIMLANLEESK